MNGIQKGNSFNKNEFDSYLEELEGYEEDVLKGMLENKIEILKERISSSKSYLISLRQTNKSVIFLVLGVIFGSIINFYGISNTSTNLLWCVFMLIYTHLIFSYFLTRIFLTNYELEDSISNKYLDKLVKFKFEKLYISGLLSYELYKNELKYGKYSDKLISCISKLQNSLLYAGIFLFITQLMFAFFFGYSDRNLIEPSRFFFSDFIESTLEFFNN